MLEVFFDIYDNNLFIKNRLARVQPHQSSEVAFIGLSPT